jgi:hypothetical protein
VIIFDWDDTLLASTCLAKYTPMMFYRKGALPRIEADQVRALEEISLKILKSSLDMPNTKTYIITNA